MNRWIQKLFSNTRLDLHKQEHQELTLFYRIPPIRSKEFAVVSISVSDNYLRSLYREY